MQNYAARLYIFAEMEDLKSFLDRQAEHFENPGFIANDPIQVPHSFVHRTDIEIAGLFAAVFSWGQRKSIIRKSLELMALMDHAPHEFVVHHEEQDLKRLLSFRHRTFQTDDLLYFIRFLQHHYTRFPSLEDAFNPTPGEKVKDIETALIHFHRYFFSLDDAPKRTRKHVATPERHSACKRLNMYLRWMVRPATKGVDFGLWKSIAPHQLICPLDVHTGRVARQLGLLRRKANDWKAALELTEVLRSFDPDDPVKYDYALFNMGLEGS